MEFRCPPRTASALSQARRRIGSAQLRVLFDLVRGPAAAGPATTGVWWRGRLVCAIDGTQFAAAPKQRTRRLIHQLEQLGHTVTIGPVT